MRYNGVSHKLKAHWKTMLPKVNKYNLFYFIFIVVNVIHFVADLISCVEFNHDGELLATGDKGGRVVIFQRDPMVSNFKKLKFQKK